MEAELKQAYAQADEANRLMNGLVLTSAKTARKKPIKSLKAYLTTPEIPKETSPIWKKTTLTILNPTDDYMTIDYKTKD